MNNKRGSDVEDAISNFCAWARLACEVNAAVRATKIAWTRAKRSPRRPQAREEADNARTVFEQPQPIAPITN